MNWRAQPPALAGTGCGCFLPDLTRLTRLRCGEARRFTLCRSETPSAVSFSQAVSQALEGVRKVPFFVRILLHRGAFRAMVSTPCARKPPGVFFCAGRQIGGGESDRNFVFLPNPERSFLVPFHRGNRIQVVLTDPFESRTIPASQGGL